MIDDIADMGAGSGDVVFVDATHEDSGFDFERLLARLGGLRALILTPEGVLDSLGPRRTTRPATLAALMALVGEACGVSEAACRREAGADNAWRDLTPREREVALLLLEGKSNKEIANEIGLSDNTVKMHLTQIMRRLHVTNRTQVVLLLGSARDLGHAPADGEGHEARRRKAGSSLFDEDPALRSLFFGTA